MNRTSWTLGAAALLLAAQPAVLQAQASQWRALWSQAASRFSNGIYDEVTFDLAQQALRAAERETGAESLSTAGCHSLIAQILTAQGRLDEAASAHATAAALFERGQGRYGPDLASELDRLAVLLYNRGNYLSAVGMWERMLAIREKILSPEDPFLATSMKSVATGLVMKGDFARATSLLQRAASIYARQPRGGIAALDEARVQRLLVASLRGQGAFARAEAAGVRALELFQQSAASRPSEVADTRRELEQLRQAMAQQAGPAPQPTLQAAARARPAPAGLAQVHPRLLAPKGYEQVKPATLYAFGVDWLGHESGRWIVARSREQATQIARTVYAFHDQYYRCYSGEYCAGNPPLLEIGFGWMAVAVAYQPNSPGVRGTYAGYAAATRQEAVDTALDVYRRTRGDKVIQYMTVGLVSEFDWRPELESAERRRQAGETNVFPAMNRLNYRTWCVWLHEERRPIEINTNPNAASGDIDRDPRCRNEFRPDEKLPPPALVVGT
jgi:tetratricopeptide (TPR) repeat protein